MLGQHYAKKLNLIRKDLTFSKGALLTAAGALALLLVVLVVQRPSVSAPLGGADSQAMHAYAARLNGLAQAHVLREAQRARVLAAETARWNGLAEAYDQPVTPQGMRPHPNDVIGAYYAAQAIRLYVETGNADYLPQCLAPGTRAALPSIGDNRWRLLIGSCE